MASSHSESGEGDTNSDAQSDVHKRKVRQKKKPHQSNEESDEETAPKVMTAKTRDHPDEDAKRTSHDSGLGEGTTTNPIGDGTTVNPLVGSFGADAAVLGLRYAVGIGGGRLSSTSYHPALHGYFGGVD